MSAPLSALAAAFAVVVVHLVARFAMRLSPGFVPAARLIVWPIAGGLVALATVVAALAGASYEGAGDGGIAGVLGLAARGPAGVLAASGLALAAMVALALVLQLAWPRRRDDDAPVPVLALLFGVAPDGSALERVRRPLRWAANASTLALLAALAASGGSLAPVPFALALALFTAFACATSRPPRALAVPSARETPAPVEPDALDALHAALGAPPLFEREAATAPGRVDFAALVVRAMSEGRDVGQHAQQRLVAVAAPAGAGKRRAAALHTASLAERGLATLTISDRPGPDALTVAAFVDALARGVRFPRLGLVVVEAAAARSAERLALMRYGLHRLRVREGLGADLDVLVLGEGASVVTIARAIGAAEPRVVTPPDPLPTRAIQRYLLASPPPPSLVASPPPAVRFVRLDRPAPLARYPDAPTVAREYLVPVGGPRGRRMREDRAAKLVGKREPRLVVALPGDRLAPSERDNLARLHLRAALAEAPQDPVRLREVFSAALVDAELAALGRSGLVTPIKGWAASPTGGLVPTTRLRARLPPALLEGPARAVLVEPRGARRIEVSADVVARDHFDGAIVTLDDRAGAERFEVRDAGLGHPGSPRVLVPTALVHATPLRTQRVRLAEPPRATRLRFRGAREIEVWEGPVVIDTVHRGVRQYGSDADASDEVRATTRLLPEPIVLPPLATHARSLVLAPAPSAAALHALAHAFAELLPCFFDNAGDLGVTFTLPDHDPVGVAALVLYDAHPDGLGAVADLRDDDLEALLHAAIELLECTCAAHCARCCESLGCTLDGPAAALDRREALRVLCELVVPRPIPLGAKAETARLRRTG